MTDSPVTRAIEESIRDHRIVELEAVIDTPEWIKLAATLQRECKRHKDEADEILRRRLYSGKDRDGNPWQIRLTGTGKERG